MLVCPAGTAPAPTRGQRDVSLTEGATMYKRILVPIDGSDTARRGLKEAIALATEQKATLRLFHVTSDFPIMVETANTLNFDKYREGLHQYGREQLENAKTLAKGLGLEVETHLLDLKGGRVADAIVQEAKDSGCDLIVIGTHGRRGFNRALLGSDAESVLRASPVPVLLVRAPAPA
jgi:nucleotide-binding universal stress UspA family protein